MDIDLWQIKYELRSEIPLLPSPIFNITAIAITGELLGALPPG